MNASDLMLSIVISCSFYHLFNTCVKNTHHHILTMEKSILAIQHQTIKLEQNIETLNVRNFDMQNHIISLKGEILKKNKLLNLISYEDNDEIDGEDIEDLLD